MIAHRGAVVDLAHAADLLDHAHAARRRNTSRPARDARRRATSTSCFASCCPIAPPRSSSRSRSISASSSWSAPRCPISASACSRRRPISARWSRGGADFLPDRWWEAVLPGARDPVRRARLQPARRRPARRVRRRERAMMAQPLLSVDHLEVTLHGERAPRAVLQRRRRSTWARSEHVALVGESGCGKSVTMRADDGHPARARPRRVIGGEIRFDGEDMLSNAGGQRAALRGTAMSMVFQDPMTSLNPVFTIGDADGRRAANAPTPRLGARRPARAAARGRAKCCARCGMAGPRARAALLSARCSRAA